MPKLPRDISGRQLAKLLELLGYTIVRQTGSHIRLQAILASGIHALTIPDHDDLKIGTLNQILADIATHHHMDKLTLVEKLFYKQ